MIEKDNGGPAFPGPFSQDRGMTLRDWFAGQALLGASHALNTGDVEWIKYRGAKAAYEIADAMLEARK